MAMGETPVTIVGNLTSDPELKFTAGGAAMAKFTVASTPRSFDRESGQYKDGTAMFMRCSAWRGLAEHIADSLTKGTRVVVTGRMRQFDWQNEQGENRSMLVLEADDIGPSLLFATATPQKAQPNNGAAKAGPNPWDTPAAAAPAGAENPPF